MKKKNKTQSISSKLFMRALWLDENRDFFRDCRNFNVYFSAQHLIFWRSTNLSWPGLASWQSLC